MNDNRYDAVIRYSRDENGLIKGLKYEFNEDGSVKWRSLIDPKYIYPNEKWFTDNKQPVPESADGLSDEQCIISLAGFKNLLSIRGYRHQAFEVLSDKDGIVTVKCRIEFEPNYETQMTPVTREDIATAGTFNVNESFAPYIHTIAANRALCRVIRSFLNINIVSKEEIGDKTATESPATSTASSITPLNLMLKDGITEEKMREVCIANGLDNTWKEMSELNENGSLARKIHAAIKKDKKKV